MLTNLENGIAEVISINKIKNQAAQSTIDIEKQFVEFTQKYNVEIEGLKKSNAKSYRISKWSIIITSLASIIGGIVGALITLYFSQPH